MANRVKAAPIQAKDNTHMGSKAKDSTHRGSKTKVHMASSNHSTPNNSRAMAVVIQARPSMVLSKIKAVLLGNLDGSKLLCLG
jgi:hypothetical protein